MLYDPKWEKPKTDLQYERISLRKLTAWLETMPANAEYDYTDTTGCALAQYLQSTGVPKAESYVDMGDIPCHELWIKSIVASWPHTFCGALERARSYAAR